MDTLLHKQDKRPRRKHKKMVKRRKQKRNPNKYPKTSKRKRKKIRVNLREKDIIPYAYESSLEQDSTEYSSKDSVEVMTSMEKMRRLTLRRLFKKCVLFFLCRQINVLNNYRSFQKPLVQLF